MQNLQQQVQQLRDGLVPYLVAAARAHNSAILDAESPLLGVPVAVQGPAFGQVPMGFPETRAALLDMTGEQLNDILCSYGVLPSPIDHDPGYVDRRMRQLASHLRVPLAE
ncbi:hypothetical protein TSOC_015208 [Tetrabaena socialis]|uniref:Uncharacterized protein n=1 Tax=Tetrabaena socialis TaxID=47790 RepID=A0A2J7ZFG9_9CHLO|nr:hypothetical protein TSOC_015208 [Tetrabaena socialis]|eukprot:PNG99021.1 hypothetical protein TSOC_015208 [Tetrabaena socialis]